MPEEGETEVEKETDQISVETEEGSGVEEGHIEAFHLASVKNGNLHFHCFFSAGLLHNSFCMVCMKK